MNDTWPEPRTDYDKLLQFRCRFGLTREDVAQLSMVYLHEIEAIEDDDAVIQPDTSRRIAETLSMTEEQVRDFVPAVTPMPFLERAVREWRWTYGLTYAQAATRIRMPLEQYKRSEKKGTGKLYETILKADPAYAAARRAARASRTPAPQ